MRGDALSFRDSKADFKFLNKYSDQPAELEAHLQHKTPEWAAAITGLSVDEIEAFAALLGERPCSYLRMGYGFTRSRNGATNMHAATCISTVLGSWQYEGGGAFHTNADIFHVNSGEVKGESFPGTSARAMDQSKIGRVLTGDPEALYAVRLLPPCLSRTPIPYPSHPNRTQ